MTYERTWDPDTNPVAIELTYPPTEGTPKYKSSKRLTVIQLRKDNPGMTLEAIGQRVELTKERVRQILASENLSTRSIQRIPKPLPPCDPCGKPVSNRRLKYCGTRCRYPNGVTTFTCSYCEKSVTVMTSEYKSRTSRYDKIHCSRECRDNSRRVNQKD